MRARRTRATVDGVAARLDQVGAPEGWGLIPLADLDQERAAARDEMRDEQVTDPVAVAYGIAFALRWLVVSQTAVHGSALADLIRAADVLLGMDDAEVEA